MPQQRDILDDSNSVKFRHTATTPPPSSFHQKREDQVGMDHTCARPTYA